MAGPRSDPPWDGLPAKPPPLLEPYVNRHTIRISNVYGTSWRAATPSSASVALTEHLSFGRLAGYYRGSADQLPVVLVKRSLDPSAVHCRRWRDRTVDSGRIWLIGLTSGQVVACLSLDVNCPLTEAINLLEDCYYLDIAIGQTGLEELAAAELGISAEQGFRPERHQLVFSKELGVEDPADLLQRLIYRADLPYRREFSTISYPAELNRRPGTTAALGPYVSVLCGQQDYLENAAFISAVQAVASAVRVREIRDAAYRSVRYFHSATTNRQGTRPRRHTLERLADDLTKYELDLSVSVEAPSDLGTLVPSLRVVEFHKQVYDAIGLDEHAARVGQMLRRLEAATRTELASIASEERRADEGRRLRWTVAVGFISSVAIPISLILAFFGVNASQVDADRSMFDPAYLGVYAGVGLLAAIAVGLAIALHVHQARQRRAAYDDAGEGRPRGPAPAPRRSTDDSDARLITGEGGRQATAPDLTGDSSHR